WQFSGHFPDFAFMIEQESNFDGTQAPVTFSAASTSSCVAHCASSRASDSVTPSRVLMILSSNSPVFIFVSPYICVERAKIRKIRLVRSKMSYFEK
ncbi:MAG: hypothetical protein MRZ32_02440, partial [Bacteroidales bacterium]|nr:hypothetical protein [Bacteroidales bacterium]